MYNYAVVVIVLYKYATGVGVMGWRAGYMMRICVLYRLYICFISLLAKSRDAKSCVSQGVYAIIVKLLLNECIAMGRTGDATFCVSTELAPLSE